MNIVIRDDVPPEPLAVEPGADWWRDPRTRRLYRYDNDEGIWRWVREIHGASAAPPTESSPPPPAIDQT